MEVLFYIIFGGMLVGYAVYGIKIYKENKRILKEHEAQAPDLPEGEDVSFISYEQPFFDSYKSLN